MNKFQTVRYTVGSVRDNAYHEVYNDGEPLPFDWFMINSTRQKDIQRQSAKYCAEYTKDNTVTELITGLIPLSNRHPSHFYGDIRQITKDTYNLEGRTVLIEFAADVTRCTFFILNHRVSTLGWRRKAAIKLYNRLKKEKQDRVAA